MDDISKEPFEYFIRRAVAEYEFLHTRVVQQDKQGSIKSLPKLLVSSNPSKLVSSQIGRTDQAPELEMHMTSTMPQAAVPGSIEDSQLLRLEAGQFGLSPEMFFNTEADSYKDLQHHPPEAEFSKGLHPYTVAGTFMSVLPASVESADDLPRLDNARPKHSPKQSLDSQMLVKKSMDVGRDSERHLTSGTSSSSVQGFVAICLGDTSGAGALPNPLMVKESLERMSEDNDTISFTSALSKLIGKASYKERGLVPSIARSKTFELVTMLIVILNGIWIAIDADYNRAGSILEAEPIFQVAEHFFCFVFTIEIVIRLAAFKKKWNALCDPWFLFDTSLVLMLIVETWVMPVIAIIIESNGVGINMSVLRLLRVARLSRLARVVRSVPELCFMVKGVLQGTRAVACTLGLLLGVLYVFGIALRQLSDDTKMGSRHFGTVPRAIFTLFVQGTLLDNITLLFVEVFEESHLCAVLLFIFVVVAALTLMSMLVGVLCEVMNNVAIQEKQRMAVSYVKEQLLVALEELDTNMDQLISKEEFVHMISNEKASKALKNVGVDVLHLVDFADYYFQSDKHGEAFNEKWSFNQFIEEIMLVRGVNAATVRDTVELRKFIHAQNTSQNMMLKHVQENQTVLAKNQVKLERLILRGNPKASHCDQSERSSDHTIN